MVAQLVLKIVTELRCSLKHVEPGSPSAELAATLGKLWALRACSQRLVGPKVQPATPSASSGWCSPPRRMTSWSRAALPEQLSDGDARPISPNADDSYL